jgi:hypothetical protein
VVGGLGRAVQESPAGLGELKWSGAVSPSPWMLKCFPDRSVLLGYGLRLWPFETWNKGRSGIGDRAEEITLHFEWKPGTELGIRLGRSPWGTG